VIATAEDFLGVSTALYQSCLAKEADEDDPRKAAVVAGQGL
jgi:hypothetical protein